MSFTALVLLGALSALTASGAPSQPPRVSAIEVRLDAPLGRPLDIPAQLTFGTGDRLDEASVRRSLSNLYATGLVSEVEIWGRPDPEAAFSVVAMVVLRGHTWIEDVRLEGVLGLKRFELARAVAQRAGAPLSESRILQSVFALRDLYDERGYRSAGVRLAFENRGVKRQALVFTLDAGERTRIGDVRFEGDLGRYDPDGLLEVLEVGPGGLYSERRVENDAERLQAWLVEKNHLQARVEAPRTVVSDTTDDELHLVYPVRVGPRIEVTVRGDDLATLERKKLLLFLEQETYDEALMRQSCDRLVRHYQEKGHFRVRVDCRQTAEAEDRLRVSIDVERGPLYTLESVVFEGNATFDQAALEPLIGTTARRALKRKSGRMVGSVLREDLDNLRSFYILQGFSAVQIGPERLDEGGTPEAPTLALTIPIVEGPRRRVVRLEHRGLAAVEDVDALLARLPLKAGGGPFHPVLLDESLDLVRARYEDEGYPAALVDATLDWNDETTLVDVFLTVDQGPRSVVDRVVLRGHRRTRESLLRRVIDLRAGDPLSRRRLLQVERELYALGVFSRVEAELGPSTELGPARDVIVTLEEGRRWRLGYGLSYHSDDGLGGVFSINRGNLGGRAGRLQLDLRGNRRDQRARLIFDQPSLGRWQLPLTVTLFFEEEERPSFTTRDRGLRLALRRDFGRLRSGLNLDYRLVDLLVPPPSVVELEREDNELRIASLAPFVLLDRRDDPFDPTRGWSAYLQAQYAFPFADADTELLRLFWQQTAFVPLGRAGVLAGSLRLGALRPFDGGRVPDPLVPGDLPSRLVPISERFFAGGRTSHRAYERDRLAIPGETSVTLDGEPYELGGTALVLLNLDWRFPIAGAFGGTLFVDAGNVWGDYRDVDLTQAKLGVGLGLRYRSPIGPLRFEVGWKLDPEPGARNPVFLLSFGNPF